MSQIGAGLKRCLVALQIHWDLVLGLATDATPPQTSVRPGAPGAAGQGDPGDPLNASVRRHAVAVMDAVDRNGLVAPWTAIPHLLALTTDPNRRAPQCTCVAVLFCRRQFKRFEDTEIHSCW